jgi:hypothetical protein
VVLDAVQEAEIGFWGKSLQGGGRQSYIADNAKTEPGPASKVFAPDIDLGDDHGA